MHTVQEKQAVEARERYRAQLKQKTYPTTGMVHTVHQGPNRAQRRAVKYGVAPRKHAQTRQQNIAFA